MHIAVCLAGQTVDVEVGEDCRTLQALQEAIVKELPQLCVEGFDVSVGGRALDDEAVGSLEESTCLDVAASSRGLSVLALREAGREVSEAGMLGAAEGGDVALCMLYLDAGVPIDCADGAGETSLHLACRCESLSLVARLLDRGIAIDTANVRGETPLHLSCCHGYVSLATLLLDRGSRAIDLKTTNGDTPLHFACWNGFLQLVKLLLARGTRAINEKNIGCITPLQIASIGGHESIVTLLLDHS